jgi:AcrR family transcriptional regulator
VVVHHQRERMLNAVVEVVAERGYRSISVGDIVKQAAIARAKFYENFSSKEDCFLAAYDRVAAELAQAVTEACAGAAGSTPERMHAALAAIIDYLDAHPVVARAWVVEAPAVGQAVEARRERAQRDFAALVRGGDAQADAVFPESIQDSVLAGLYWLVYHAILSGRPEKLGAMLPELTEFALMPGVGVDEARRAAREVSVSAG